jgi:hypothetical protein
MMTWIQRSTVNDGIEGIHPMMWNSNFNWGRVAAKCRSMVTATDHTAATLRKGRARLLENQKR